MMRKSFVTAAVLPLLTLPGVAPADTSLGIRGGTLGGGVELSYALSQASTHGDSAPAERAAAYAERGVRRGDARERQKRQYRG
ncbi:MAG TPA: hypothetical protein VK583_02755, partial [Burkholderiales bacterium]|nr:hypothetical protein [Burkholderiales bacterium]